MGGSGSGGRRWGKSAEVHVVEGTYKPSRHARRRKADPDLPATDPPEHLGGAERAVWSELAAVVRPTARQRLGFELLVGLITEFRQNRAMPTARVAVLRGLCNDFGMTLTSSERLVVGEAVDRNNPFAQFSRQREEEFERLLNDVSRPDPA
jgi:hypothetical protein